jgi:hypothetical protein
MPVKMGMDDSPTKAPLPGNGRRLDWQESRPKRFADFTGRDPGNKDMLAHIYAVINGPQDGNWFWTVSDGRHIGSGHEITRIKAARKAEAAYFGQIRDWRQTIVIGRWRG